MKYLNSYFFCCLKKAFKRYFAILITAVFLVTALFFVADMILDIDQNDISKQRVKVGIVGDLSETYMGLSFSTLATIDDIGLSIEFVEMNDVEDAEDALEKFDISAYVYVPDNYIMDIVRGRDVQLSFVMPKSSAVASNLLMREIVEIISPLVTEAESGVYAMKDYFRSIGGRGVSKYTDELNLEYIDTILSRAETIELRSTGVQTLLMKDYYICGIITFFLLIFSVSCCMIFSDKQLALGRLFCSRNVKTWQLIMCEYLSYTLVMLVTMVIIAIPSSVFLTRVNFATGGAFELVFYMLPCIFMISAMHIFIYESTGSIVAGVLAQFITAVSMGYISGCFYPYYFFPESIQKISGFLPSGITFKYLRQYVMGERDNVVLICFAYTAVFLLLASMIRKYRLRRGTV